VATSIINVILSLLRTGREYLRDMSKAPLQKIEETLDIATLIWMLLYGCFPYPTAQQQIEEQIGNIERTIEENPEQAKQGFSWLYRIGNVYRFVHIQPVWVTDVLNYKIGTLLHKTINDYLQSSDLLNYHISTLFAPSLRTDIIKAYDSVGYSTEKYEIIDTHKVLHKELRLSEKTIIYDILTRIIIPVIRPTFIESITLSEALEKYISSLTAKTFSESLSLTDGVNILTRGKSLLTYSETLTLSDELISSTKPTVWRFAETLTLSDEIAPETYTFKQLITLTFDEVLSVVDGGITGYPYPEEPSKTYMKYELAESIKLLDLMQSIATSIALISGIVSATEWLYSTPAPSGRKIVRGSDGTLYCVYVKEFNGYHHIFIRKSTDNGNTWIEETRISNHPSLDNYHQHYPAIAIDSQNRIYIVWQGYCQETPNAPQLWFSMFDGNNWTTPVMISQGFDAVTFPSIAVDSQDRIHVVFQGQHQYCYSYYQIFYTMFDGSNWLTPVRISTYSGMENENQENPCIAIDLQDRVHVVWHGKATGYSSYYQIWYVKYEGGSWLTPVRISTYSGMENYDQILPSIAIDLQDRVHVVWEGKATGYDDYIKVWYCMYDGGWSTPECLHPDGQNRYPNIRWSYYPSYNRMTNRLEYVYTSGTEAPYNIVFVSRYIG